MLSPRLNNCPECADIPSLLKKIDCKLAELGNNLYNNISYMLNKPVPADDILQLIGYRRILTYKYCNPNYVCKYSVKMIASRVIRLTLGCVSRCNEPERCLEEPCDIIIVPNPVRTTTTTSSSSTTTSTTTIPPTSTTTTSSSSTSSTTTTSTTSNSTAGCPVGYYGPVGFPNRYTGNGTMTLASGLVISTTYAGPLPLLSLPSPPFTNCVGGQFGGDVGTGGSIFLNYSDGAFTFIITYSTAQTAVKFVTYGMGYADQLGISEYYTFTTNAANTVVTELAGCNDFRVEPPNVVAGSMPSPENRTGGNVEVVADAPFTTITITGNNPGSLNGTGFDMYICGIEPTTTTTSSSSSTSTTTSSSSTTSTTTTLAPSGIRTIYTHFESLTPLTTTTTSSSTSTSSTSTTSTTIPPTSTTTSTSTSTSSTTTTSTTIPPTSTTTSTSSSTSTTTSTSSTTTTTTTGVPIFGIGNILGTSSSSPFFRIYDNTLIEISQLPSVGVTADYAINASDNYQYSIAATNTGSALPLKVSSNYGSSYSIPIGAGSPFIGGTSISKNGKYMYVEFTPGGSFLRSDNFGTSFSPVSFPVAVNGFSQTSVSWDGQYVIIGCYGTIGEIILLSTDYGITFTNITLNIFPSQSVANSSDIQCAAVSGNGLYMMVLVAQGDNYRSINSGVTWQTISVTAQDFREELKLSYDGRYGVVGSINNRVITTNNFGVGWTTRTFSSSIIRTDMSNSGQYMLATLFSGQTQISSNYGVSWTSYSNTDKKYLSFIN